MMEETETVLGTVVHCFDGMPDMEHPTDHLFHRLGVLYVGTGRIHSVRPV